MFIIGYDKNIKKLLDKQPEEIYINDFDDGYHRVSEDGDALPSINIKQFYRNIPDYIVARNQYDEYMENLANKEISPEVFKILKRSEAIAEYIPPKPKIKNSRESRILCKLEKKGAIISKVINNEGMGRRELRKYAEETGVNPDDVNSEIIVLSKKDYKVRFGDIKPKKKKDVPRITERNLHECFENYFKTSYTETKKKDTYFPRIPDVLNETSRFKKWLEGDDDTHIVANGRVLTKDRLKESEMLRALRDAGWQIDKLSGLSEEEKRRVAREKKVNKKIAKQRKKSEKKFDKFFYNRFADVDDDNYRAFESEYLNLTSNRGW